ncbi:MAG: NAD-dependent protein deacylase, partial [Clostridiales bacterium]|nr:NAD-dependent protein deacylase [Clostridiales bacterium]
MHDGVRTLADWVRDAGRIAFFGGAGVSTESGLPDFRSAGGLYQRESGGASPEEILS